MQNFAARICPVLTWILLHHKDQHYHKLGFDLDQTVPPIPLPYFREQC